MRVFILGGTGSIGTAIVRELHSRSHDVVALCRSEISEEKIRNLGAIPYRGDMRAPEAWVNAAIDHDAIIQTAATFTEDMEDVDARVVSALIYASANAKKTRRLLYTGGCWLYGETGGNLATEDWPFNPLPAFAWMVRHAERLLRAEFLSTAVVHPAMVYSEDGGVFEEFIDEARGGRAIEIWGSPDTRWPIIHRSDLARAYCDLLERPDLTGHFNAGAEQGVRVSDIVKTLADRHGNTLEPLILGVEDLVERHGDWAKGPTLDQQMSSHKLRQATGWEPKVGDYRLSDLLA
ncbi:NAD-dependent epimerase/dehydratase family protein [Stappia sp. ES.058]|uniref:NAD-dependent epimerase/dehydratase family protein n=1 Tax=Stappia sp. ES.058 TaxID=1881061 RepID=UPI00087D704A|nr:NAD-dependent epimerase/dehydratase family protein [Stappia sp. ES.058]SDU42834.1 Nucleoside-diphosphate-sugar epimerase [Stappia sp. ES.058]